MPMKRPRTVGQWVGLISSVVVLISTFAGGIYTLHQSNAYASDLASLEAELTEGLKAWTQKQQSDQCAQWLSEITMLESREASGQLSAGQRDRLIWLRNMYEAECTGNANR